MAVDAFLGEVVLSGADDGQHIGEVSGAGRESVFEAPECPVAAGSSGGAPYSSEDPDAWMSDMVASGAEDEESPRTTDPGDDEKETQTAEDGEDVLMLCRDGGLPLEPRDGALMPPAIVEEVDLDETDVRELCDLMDDVSSDSARPGGLEVDHTSKLSVGPSALLARHTRSPLTVGTAQRPAQRVVVLVTSVSGFLGVPAFLRRVWFRTVRSPRDHHFDEVEMALVPRVFVSRPVLELALAILRDRCDCECADVGASISGEDHETTKTKLLSRIREAQLDLELFERLRARLVVEMHLGERVRVRREVDATEGVCASMRALVNAKTPEHGATEPRSTERLDGARRGTAGDEEDHSVLVEARPRGNGELGGCYFVLEGRVFSAQEASPGHLSARNEKKSSLRLAVGRGTMISQGASGSFQPRALETAPTLSAGRIFQPRALDQETLNRCDDVFWLRSLSQDEPATIDLFVTRILAAYARWREHYNQWKTLDHQWLHAQFAKLFPDGPPKELSAEHYRFLDAAAHTTRPEPPAANFLEIPISSGELIPLLDVLHETLHGRLGNSCPGFPVLIAGKGLAAFVDSLDRWLEWMPSEQVYGVVCGKRSCAKSGVSGEVSARRWIGEKKRRSELLLRPKGVRLENLHPGAFHVVVRALAVGEGGGGGSSTSSSSEGEGEARETKMKKCRVKGQVVGQVMDYVALGRS